jgi:hypothetical protein
VRASRVTVSPKDVQLGHGQSSLFSGRDHAAIFLVVVIWVFLKMVDIPKLQDVIMGKIDEHRGKL